MHTFEIKIKISEYIYCDLRGIPAMKEINANLCRSNYYQKKGILQIELRIHSYTNDKTGIQGYQYYLVLQINASVLVGSGVVYALKLCQFSKEQIINSLQQRLYEINEFRRIKLDKVHKNLWITERVDLAMDLVVENPELIALLCNLGIPYGYRNMKRIPINKSLEALYHESCCFGSKSRRLNFYNKKAAVINTGRKSDVDISELDYIFRLEYQILKQGVIYTGRKTVTKRSIELYMNEEFVNDYMLSEIEVAFGRERYVNRSTAMKLIDECMETPEEKSKMIATIDLIHKMNGLYEVELALKNGESSMINQLGSYDTFKQKRLRKIRQLGINPATIPDLYGIDELPSLYDMLKEEIRCQKVQLGHRQIG